MFPKLIHPTSSIRQRCLESIHFKLFQTNTLSVSEVLNQEFLQQLLQYFTFPEVPCTIKALEILKAITKVEQGCVLLLNLEAMLLLQQLKILLPSDRMKELVGEICSELARVRSESTYFQVHHDSTGRTLENMKEPTQNINYQSGQQNANEIGKSNEIQTERTIPEYGIKPHVSEIRQQDRVHPKEDYSIISNDISSIVADRTTSVEHVNDNLSTRNHGSVTNSGERKANPTITNAFVKPPRHALTKNEVLSEADEALLFQLNVKLRQFQSDLVMEALNELEEFLLKDINIRVMLVSKLEILESVLILLNASLPSNINPKISEGNASNRMNSKNLDQVRFQDSEKGLHQLDVRAADIMDLFVDELLNISALESGLALHVFHLILIHSIPCLKKVECSPRIISYLRKLFPFMEQCTKSPALEHTWIVALDLITDWFQNTFSEQTQAFDYIELNTIYLLVNILSRMPPSTLKAATPKELRRALIMCSQLPSIYFMNPETYTIVGGLLEYIDQNAAKDVQQMTAAINSLQLKDKLMTSASIFEEKDPQDLSEEQIENELQNISSVLLSQAIEPNKFIIERILHELFLLGEIISTNKEHIKRCQSTLKEILSHPSPVVRATSFTFLMGDLESFITNYFEIDILVIICLDTMSEFDQVNEAASQLIVSIFKRIDTTDRKYFDAFGMILPLLQSSILEGRPQSSDVLGIVNMISEQLQGESITIQTYCRFLFHKAGWIREMSGKQLSKILKYPTTILDPFSKFFDDDTFHESMELFESRSLKTFDVESAKNVLRLIMSPSLDVRISAEIASQIAELIKVKRFRHLFATKEFLYFLLTSIENEQTAYIAFVEKCLVVLRVLLHFEPRFRLEIRNDPSLLLKIGRNIFHTDLEIRLITCKVLALLVFSPEVFSFNEDSFSYTWCKCSDDLQKEYLPNGKHLPFLSIPEFLHRGYFISRGASTYLINVKRKIHYPTHSCEDLIRRLKYLREKNIIDVIRGKVSSTQLILSADIEFLKHCRNIDLFCIVKSRMHAVCNDPTSLIEHVAYLNSIWYINPSEMSRLVYESDWKRAFGDFIERIPTSSHDDECISHCCEMISNMLIEKVMQKDDIEYCISVVSSNLLDILNISSAFWEELPEHYYSNYLSNIVDRRTLKHDVIQLISDLASLISKDQSLQSICSESWIDSIVKVCSQYLDSRLFQHKHIFLQTQAAKIISLFTKHSTFYGSNWGTSSQGIYSLALRMLSNFLLHLLQRSSFIGTELENFLIVAISNIGSIFSSHNQSWIIDDAVQIANRLLKDYRTSRNAFGLHILSQGVVCCDDLQTIFSLEAFSKDLLIEACQTIFDVQSDILIRDQSMCFITNIIRLLVLNKEKSLDDILLIIGCTGEERNLTPLMRFLVTNKIHLKFHQLLREERSSKCFEEIVIIFLQYISIDSKGVHPLLQDKYVIPYLVRFLNRTNVENPNSSPYLESRMIAQSACNAICIKLLHVLFSDRIIRGQNFEEAFPSISTIILLLDCIASKLDDNEALEMRLSTVRLFGILLHASTTQPPANFCKALASKEYCEEITKRLIAIYLELYSANKYFSNDDKLIDDTMMVTGCLSLMLSERESTKQIALDQNFVNSLVSVIEQLCASIQVEQASKKIQRVEHFKYYLYSNLRLIRTMIIGNISMKEKAVECGIIQHIRYLWTFSISHPDESLKYELLSLLLNLVSSCPLGLKELIADVNVVSKGLNKVVLLDRLVKFASNASLLQKTPFRLMFLTFRILSCLAIDVDTRTVIIKYNLVEGFINLLTEYLKLKDSKRIEVILHFLVSLSTSKEGQSHILKTKGLLDILQSMYELPHDRVKSHTLLIIRNLSFEKQNKAFFLQDTQILQLLLDCIFARKIQLSLEHRCIASSALWCLIYNNQKGRFMIQKFPSLKMRIQELSEKLQIEFSMLNDGKRWETCQCEKKKSDEYLLHTTLKQLQHIEQTLIKGSGKMMKEIEPI